MSEYKVMVPLDGSRLAEHALAYLETLKQVGMVEVLLLSVVEESFDFLNSGLQGLLEFDQDRLADYLDRTANSLRSQLNITVRTSLVVGNPAASINAAARGYNPDLLLLATHGQTGDLQWRLGGVADKVVRGVDCPTLIVPVQETMRGGLYQPPTGGFRTVLVALDGSSRGEEATAIASRFALATGAFMHLVHVVPQPSDEEPYCGNTTDNLTRERVEQARLYLSRVAAGLNENVQGCGTVLVGSPAAQLREYVQANDIDLVVMTQVEMSDFRYASLGSVIDRMLGGPKPLLIVHPDFTLPRSFAAA